METLLLVVSVVWDVVFLQKLCMFLPQDFGLFLKSVGPEKKHRRHNYAHKTQTNVLLQTKCAIKQRNISLKKKVCAVT